MPRTPHPSTQSATREMNPVPNPSNPSPPDRHPLALEDLWTMERLGSPALSPDGHLAIFPLTTYDRDENTSETHLWLVPTDGSAPPRRLTWQKGKHAEPAWSPDSREIVFTSKRGDDEKTKTQLYRLALDGGEAEPLTEMPSSVSAPRWLGDGRRIAFVADTFAEVGDDLEALAERLQALEDDKVGAQISDNRLVRYWDAYRTDGRVPHVFLLDLDSRAVRDLMAGWDGLFQFMSFAWDIAPDGRELAVAANASPPPWRELDMAIYLLPLAEDGTPGERRLLAEDSSVADRAPHYSPDGRHLLFARNLRPSHSADFTRLARLDRASGEISLLAADWDREISGWEVSEDGSTILITAQDEGRGHLWALPIDAASDAAPRELLRGGVVSNPVAAEGGRLILLRNSFDSPASLWTAQLEGTSDAAPRLDDLRLLADPNRERVAQIDFGSLEDVRFTGADDEPVQLWVVKPPDFDPSKTWPFVLLIHGGPHSAWLDTFHYRWHAALFAAQGWVVGGLNFHGSSGFGQAFCESIEGAHAEKPFADAMRAVDHMLAEGYIDPDRLAAAGGSFGGYMVSWILGHSDRFQALVSHAGVFDLMAQFASDYTWHRGTSYGAEPWEDPQRIDQYSPSRYAEHFSTPTLILHGERDYRVPVTQSFALHHMLVAKGVPSRLAIFPKENHWILKPQAAEIWWKEIESWIERYVGRGPTP